VSQTASFFQSPEALELATEISKKLDGSNQLSLIGFYRKRGVDAELLTFALNQARFKQRGKAKFGERSLSMLFTEAGLEQATRAQVATWHAERFKKAGIKSLTDLGAGIGSDSIGFATAGLEVVALENHPESFQALSHNLAFLPDAVAIQQDAESHQSQDSGSLAGPSQKRSGSQVTNRPALGTWHVLAEPGLRL
jgi:hypothetical protein